MKTTIQTIKTLLNRELPGVAAQKKMLPEGREIKPKSNRVKESAVLLLIYPADDSLYLCLTKRNLKLKHHPGQISFPGGKCESNETPIQTALRETFEEIGIEQKHIEVLGKLTEVYVSVSNFNIHPFVAYIDHTPSFIIDAQEVADVIPLKIDDVTNEKNHTTTTVSTSIGPMQVPCYLIDNHIIWGATSMMIAELEAILKQGH